MTLVNFMSATRDSFPFTTKILRSPKSFLIINLSFSEYIHSNCRFVLIFVLSLISKTSFPLISPLQIKRYKVDFRYTLKYLVFVETRTLRRLYLVQRILQPWFIVISYFLTDMLPFTDFK